MKNLALKKTLSILILTLYHTLTYSQNKNSNTYYESAMIHKQKEEYSESIKDLDKAIEIMPLTIYYYNRGIAYFILKQFEKAISDFNRTLIQWPGNFDSYVILGDCYFNKKEYPKAIKYYETAIKIKSNDSNVYFCLGLTECQLKNYQKAISYFSTAISIKKEVRYYYSRGNTYSLIEDDLKAYDDFSEIIKLTPNDPFAYLNRGISNYNLNRYNLAINDFDMALKIDLKIEKAAEYKNICLSFIEKNK